MMISQSAIWCLEATLQRLMRRPPLETAAEPEPRESVMAHPLSAEKQSEETILHTVVEPTSAAGRSRSIPETSQGAPLTANERRARAAALSALAFSRGRRFDAARSAFTDAATLDPTLDLTRTPAFWKLERAAHEAAIDAYLTAGRDRDAAVLRAQVRTTFRPRALRSNQEPALHP